MFAIGASCMLFIRLKIFIICWHFLSISGHQILSNAFSASIEMIIFFLSFYLNVVDYIDFFLMVLELFRGALFSFQISWDFLNVFLLLIFNSVVVREHALFDLNTFQLTGTFSVAWSASFLGLFLLIAFSSNYRWLFPFFLACLIITNWMSEVVNFIMLGVWALFWDGVELWGNFHSLQVCIWSLLGGISTACSLGPVWLHYQGNNLLSTQASGHIP